jgi:hypothetical protein
MNSGEAQAKTLGLQIQRFRVAAPNPDLEEVFTALRKERADALLVQEEPVVGVYAKKIAELPAKDRVPTMFAPSRVSAGGLLSYGTSQEKAIRHMAMYRDKVLKGPNRGMRDATTVLDVGGELLSARPSTGATGWRRSKAGVR